MDFAFTEDQQGLVGLCRQMFGELCAPEAIAQLEKSGQPVFHKQLWSRMAESELLGLNLKEDVGGLGLGMVEVCLIHEQAGWVTAPLPLTACLAMGAPALDRFGSDALRQAVLPGVIRGESILCATTSRVSATQTSEGFTLHGELDCVPWAPVASHIVLLAEHASQLSALCVELKGLEVERQTASNEEPLGRIRFAGHPVPASNLLGELGHGETVSAFMSERGQVAQAASILGMAARALRLTAKYATERQQFGRAIGTFQAVGQRAADAFVDVETIRVALWRAAWLLDDAQPATAEVLVASYWAKDAGNRVVNAAQHIHGGIGFDRDYPLYRYFLGVKTLEQRMGSATSCLSELGRRMAQE
ncbi:MAG: acyl-CoA/acyl-ACP dehydrogenase [Polyangiaceae bacterium]|nr:acyl-CoA/acyl-ACP dehydrogenase [Polyangiaceae bacterium]